MDDIYNVFKLLNISYSDELIYDMEYIVFCYTNQHTIDMNHFKIPILNRDYKAIVSVMREFHPILLNNEFLEILPIIDEYLEFTN